MPESCKTTHGEGEEMKLKVSKLLLEGALIFQAKHDVRYYLNGICFMPDGRVAATDGHRAMIASKHGNKIKSNVIVSVSKSPTKNYSYAVIDTRANIVTYHDNFDEFREFYHDAVSQMIHWANAKTETSDSYWVTVTLYWSNADRHGR